MKERSQLSLNVQFDQTPQQEIPLMGFLFYCHGLFLQRAMVRENRLEFNLADVKSKDSKAISFDPSEVRVFIAPAFDKKIQQVTSIEALEAYKPYEPVLTHDVQGEISILPIPNIIAQFWPFCTCRVTGKVSKWFHVGHTWVNRAVCRARVHICEVDRIRYWIYKIPDTIIAKIPEQILRPREVIKIPIPTPDPPPFKAAAFTSAAQASIFKTNSAEEFEMQAAAALPELGVELRQQLASGNLNLVREAIINNYQILHPWFCLWPWFWPYFYRCTERKVVYTDASGRFDTDISYWCFGDKPDIYIWIEYLIDGAWTTVYHPPIPCYTRWNYLCGTDINVQITDPRVPGNCCCNCNLPGEIVWIRSIGNSSVSHINQSSLLQAPPGQTVPYDRTGMTDAAAAGDGFFATSVGDYKRPYGGTLSLYMGFGSDLPNTAMYYYRWSYRKTADADLSAVAGTQEHISNVEMKAYDFTYIDSNGDQQIGHNSVKLGPFSKGSNDGLYIIPPTNPSLPPFAVLEDDPTWFERTRNTHTITVDSSQLKNAAMNGGDGLYEFVLELFDSAGALITDVPKTTFKVPNYDDADISVNAPENMLVASSLSTASAFKMLVRVDNSACNSQIFTVNVNGAPASTDCCGFVKYKPGGVEADLQLSFLATHPNNFAVFSFGVSKGTCGPVPGADAQGMVIDDASGYTLNSGIYDKHFTPQQLLDNCYHSGTGKAAFAETLSVIAIATDGYNRQSGKDAPYRVAAFALEP